MKIDASRTSPASPTAAPQKTRLQNTTNPVATNSPAADGSVTTHLQTTGGASATQAPFDSQRVAEIRQAIAEGRFQINTDKIADRLIGDVRDFLAKDQPAT
ncbi:MAG: flagellar biosynthesis anti-sigma factor FlgM [Rugosibacter sp.]|nr:MAG: flagellar biosynthesis anti-sigma factor FlgM [Rugosibacter sp.]TBR09588.1 MAG: flagellar biosynthesis anti-sigma factor FlgM [Rugosibacter sp.]